MVIEEEKDDGDRRHSQWQDRIMSLRWAFDAVISLVPGVNEIASLRSQWQDWWKRLLHYVRNDKTGGRDCFAMLAMIDKFRKMMTQFDSW